MFAPGSSTLSRSFFALLLFLLWPGLAAAGVQGGRGAGGVELGWSFAKVKETLGEPRSSHPSPSHPGFIFHRYPDRGLSVFVNDQGRVIGIAVSTPAHRTPEGIRVGSARAEVEQAYGKGIPRGPGNVNYPGRGLAFRYRDGRVEQIYVFRPERDRPLLGDRLIIPGRRVGEIRLGQKSEVVLKAWGPPDRTSPLAGAAVALYAGRGVGVIIRSGRIEGLLVETGDFMTREGIQVGSTRDQVVAALGPGYTESGPQLYYSERGIGFVLEGNQVVEIQVLAPR